MKTVLSFFICCLCALQLQAQCTADFTTSQIPWGSTNQLWIQLINTSTYGSFSGTQTAMNSVDYGDGTALQYYANFTFGYHNYANPGTYTVKLKINKIDSLTSIIICQDSITHSVTVNPSPCTATISKVIGANGQVTFTANNPGGTPGIIYHWNFGDGSPGVTGSPVTHTYSQNGTYNVILSDTVIGGCTSTVSTSVAITNIPFNCSNLYASFYHNITNNHVYFHSTSSVTASYIYNGLVADWSWDFGDGYSSVGNNVSHNYTTTGTYTATLTFMLRDSVTNAVVCSDTAIHTITINSIAAPMVCANQSASFTYTISNNSVTFTNTSATGFTRTTNWRFGDGSSSTSNSGTVSHFYPVAGSYNVKLFVFWIDTIYNTVCRDSIFQTINITNSVPPLNCAALNASFTASVNNHVATFTNTSTANPSPFVSRIFTWSFGDGTGAYNGNNVATHNYTNYGTYNVILTTTWHDSLYNTNCSDTQHQQIAITPPPSTINGVIIGDSTRPGARYYKVWLIRFDSLANTLTAVDSTTAIFPVSVVPYSFNNVPYGIYLVKAASMYPSPGNYGEIPTYHYSSLYWNTATSFINTVATSSASRNILMQTGIQTAGPGFIGGNVSLGANKGASGGVPGMTILLRNVSNNIVTATITDANGDYSFTNIPVGTYNVYPEQMNYATTPYNSIVVTGAQNNVINIDFNQDNAQMNIKPRGNTTAVGHVNGNEPSFSIYPNPAHNLVTLNWKNMNDKTANILIADIAGRIVSTETIKLSATNTHTLDISKLQSGIYFIKMKGADAEFSQKLSIQH